MDEKVPYIVTEATLTTGTADTPVTAIIMMMAV